MYEGRMSLEKIDLLGEGSGIYFEVSGDFCGSNWVAFVDWFETSVTIKKLR